MRIASNLASLVLLASAAMVLGVVAIGATIDLPAHIGGTLAVLGWFVAPIVVAGGLVACLRLGAAIKLQIALYLIALWLGIYGSEIYLLYQYEMAVSQGNAEALETEDLAALRDEPRSYVAMSHAQLSRRQKGGDFLSRLEPDGRPTIPLGTVANAKILLCKRAGEAITYRSDEFGFRNPAGAWRGEIEVAAVGDSYTQGVCMPDGLSFVDLIRAQRPATVNTGLRGNGPFAALAAVREYLAPRKPKTVLWFYYEDNDIPADISREMRTPALTRYVDPAYSQNLEARAPEVSAALTSFIDRMLEARDGVAAESGPHTSLLSIMVRSFRLSELRWRVGLGGYPHLDQLDALRDSMSAASAAIENWGGRLVVVYLPAQRRFGSWLGAPDLDRYRTYVTALADELGAGFVDIVPLFEANPQPDTLYEGHFSEEGNRIVADTVLEFLDR